MKTQTLSISRRALMTASALVASAAIGAAALAGNARAQEPTGDAPIPGDAAPAFTATTATGDTVSLSDFEGRTVVLEWTNHDCPFVVRHYNSGYIPGLQADAAENDVVWLQVISSIPGTQGHVSGERAIELNEERGAAPAHVLIDETSDVGRAYHAATTPHMYVIDGEGVLRYAGGIDDQPRPREGDPAPVEHFADALAQVQAGEDVTVPETQPYGCSVKYTEHS
jgi:alkyl hydroperoxide reductase subunit AhpC